MPVTKGFAVSAGDTVLYGKYDGTVVEYNGEEHMLIRDENVLLKWGGGEMTVDAVTPVWDRILIKTEGVGEETSSGIALAASAASQARITFGEVIAAGTGMISANGEIAPMDVNVGEFVKYRDYGGAEVEILLAPGWPGSPGGVAARRQGGLKARGDGRAQQHRRDTAACEQHGLRSRDARARAGYPLDTNFRIRECCGGP